MIYYLNKNVFITLQNSRNTTLYLIQIQGHDIVNIGKA